MHTEPTLGWGSRTQVSGLFVDLIMPHATWAMLHPSRPVRELSVPLSRYLPPVMAPFMLNDDMDDRQLKFPLLSFSF